MILSLILGYSDHENEHYSGVTVRQTEHSPLSRSMYDERQNILHFMSSVSIMNNMDTNYIQLNLLQKVILGILAIVPLTYYIGMAIIW